MGGTCSTCEADDYDSPLPILEDHEQKPILEKYVQENKPSSFPRNDPTKSPTPPKSENVSNVKKSDFANVNVLDRISLFEQNKKANSEGWKSSSRETQKSQRVATWQPNPTDMGEEYNGWSGVTKKIVSKTSNFIPPPPPEHAPESPPKSPNVDENTRRRSNGVSSPKPHNGRAPPNRDPSIINPALIVKHLKSFLFIVNIDFY